MLPRLVWEARDPTRKDSIRKSQEVGFRILRRTVDARNQCGTLQLLASKYRWYFSCRCAPHTHSQQFSCTCLGTVPTTLIVIEVRSTRKWSWIWTALCYYFCKSHLNCSIHFFGTNCLGTQRNRTWMFCYFEVATSTNDNPSSFPLIPFPSQ